MRSTGAAESCGVRKHGLSTNLDEEVDELPREKVALRGGLAEISA